MTQEVSGIPHQQQRKELDVRPVAKCRRCRRFDLGFFIEAWQHCRTKGKEIVVVRILVGGPFGAYV